MEYPRDSDELLVDLKGGSHYHKRGCPMTVYPGTPVHLYVVRTYGEIKKLRTRGGSQFYRCPGCFRR